MPPGLLQYESPHNRRPWGPILFKPSWLARILIILVTLNLLWLGRRHEPWRQVLQVPVKNLGPLPDDHPMVLLTSNARLLVIDRKSVFREMDPSRPFVVDHEVHSWDLTGPQHFQFPKMQNVAFLDDGATLLSDGQLFDTRTGKPSTRLWPGPKNAAAFDHALTRYVSVSYPWIRVYPIAGELTEPLAEFRLPYSAYPDTWSVEFSPDDRFLAVYRPIPRLIGGSYYKTSTPLLTYCVVYDLLTLEPRLVIQQQSPFGQMHMQIHPHLFIGKDAVAATGLSPGNKVPRQLLVRSAVTGTTIRRWSFPPPNIAIHSVTVSPDLNYLAAIINTGLTLWDLRSSRQIASRTVNYSQFGDQQIAFFPDGRRLVTRGPRPGTTAIYDVPTLHPLAIAPDCSYKNYGHILSPDAQYFATLGLDNAIRVFHKTGYECRESTLGIAGMPHAWLLGLLTVLLAVTLHRDARHSVRASIDPRDKATGAISVLLFILSLPPMLYLLLDICLAHFTPNPAPLFLLASIGLALRSRSWRLFALILCTASLPFAIDLLLKLHRLGLWQSSTVSLLDRSYPVPHLVPAILLLIIGAVLVSATPLLGRRM